MIQFNGYVEFLELHGVRDNNFKYYKIRVEQYLDFCRNRELDIHAKRSLNKYINVLERTQEGWQVKQAIDAVKYYLHWLNSQNKTFLESVPSKKVSFYLSEFIRIIRLQHKSLNTELTYLNCLRGFINFHKKEVYFEKDIELYISDLLLTKQASKSTQNLVLTVLAYFYKYILNKDVTDLCKNLRLKLKGNLPIFFTKDEIRALCSHMDGVALLMTQVIYGGGLRHSEAYQLRVQDIDFEMNQIRIKDYKNGHERFALLSVPTAETLKKHLETVKCLYDKDRKSHLPGTALPAEVERNAPDVANDWAWFWVFPSEKITEDSLRNLYCRGHIETHFLNRKIKRALEEANIYKNANILSLRHSFAVHILEDGHNIKSLQELLGHKDIRETQKYSDLIKLKKDNIKSPMEDI
jgi:site-specific recombinase XerD